ncbi:hypothetical protein [Amycolatopsis thailandensis]|uniref:hypothetical protein n=1 Tax=Amycolatopsis thailandensis TaxID=589330 RepID=UPI003641E29C
MRAVVGVVLVVMAGCVGCGADPSVSSNATTRPEQRPTDEAKRIPMSPAPPRTPVRKSEAAVPPLAPANPTPLDDLEIFANPVAVSSEWLREWCTTDWREPMNANLGRAARYQTRVGVKADLREGDNEGTYESAREQQLSSGCDEIVATPSPEAPQSADQLYVVLSARRVNSAAGVAFEEEQLRSLRRVVLQDGRWLVDERVEAG